MSLLLGLESAASQEGCLSRLSQCYQGAPYEKCQIKIWGSAAGWLMEHEHKKATLAFSSKTHSSNLDREALDKQEKSSEAHTQGTCLTAGPRGWASHPADPVPREPARSAWPWPGEAEPTPTPRPHEEADTPEGQKSPSHTHRRCGHPAGQPAPARCLGPGCGAHPTRPRSPREAVARWPQKTRGLGQ